MFGGCTGTGGQRDEARPETRVQISLAGGGGSSPAWQLELDTSDGKGNGNGLTRGDVKAHLGSAVPSLLTQMVKSCLLSLPSKPCGSSLQSQGT